MWASKQLLTLLLFTFQSTWGFYLPGMVPRSYKKGELVSLLVNALAPKFENDEKIVSLVTYDYYDERFNFCTPEKTEFQSENLGSELFGDRLMNSPFKLEMLKDTTCQTLCPKQISGEHAKFINSKIKEHYNHDWLIDGFPVRQNKDQEDTPLKSIGFDLGEYRNTGVPNFYNHFDINIDYHTDDNQNNLVVDATVSPRSIAHTKDKTDCSIMNVLSLDEKKDNYVMYTYSVTWKKSEEHWATRWDTYLKISHSSIHWFNLLFASTMVLLLVFIVATILLRTLKNDISRYNQIDLQEDLQEDFGWKLVHGDVFRSPSNFMLLSVLTGSGLQLTCMTFTTLTFAALGFLSPSMKGSFVTALVILFMIFGSVSGFISARLYKMFGGESWKSNMLISSTLVPGIIFTVTIILNFFLIGSGSSSSVPTGTMFSIIALWFLLSIPLSFAGSYFGLKKPRITHPIRTNQIPRQVPDQSFFVKAIPSILAGGIIPFMAIFTELFYIMKSLWYHKLYYMFGFLFITFLLTNMICSTMTIVLCYFHLCSENYNWWWRSFLAAGSTGFYIFLYSIIFYFKYLNLEGISSTVTYFGWSFILSLVCFLMSGAIGFLSCHFFIRKIYSSIKID